MTTDTETPADTETMTDEAPAATETPTVETPAAAPETPAETPAAPETADPVISTTAATDYSPLPSDAVRGVRLTCGF